MGNGPYAPKAVIVRRDQAADLDLLQAIVKPD
jgi:hypothetical protein